MFLRSGLFWRRIVTVQLAVRVATSASIPISNNNFSSRMDGQEELRAWLTPLQWRVTQEAGTEPPFSENFHDNKVAGDYNCLVCGDLLFTSDQKFDSGTGWPSFFDKSGSVKENVDTSHGMTRTEVVCGNCGSHLGHVFNDGPAPTGLRYCINGASLEFVPK